MLNAYQFVDNTSSGPWPYESCDCEDEYGHERKEAQADLNPVKECGILLRVMFRLWLKFMLSYLKTAWNCKTAKHFDDVFGDWSCRCTDPSEWCKVSHPQTCVVVTQDTDPLGQWRKHHNEGNSSMAMVVCTFWVNVTCTISLFKVWTLQINILQFTQE